MGSELLKMADGFALVADSLRELAGQVWKKQRRRRNRRAEQRRA